MFLKKDVPTVPPSGEKEAKVAIVGEAPGRVEITKGKPFVGPAGNVLETCLHAAGLTRAECYITNLCKYQSTGEKLYNSRKDALTVEGQHCAEELESELAELSANIVVPMGGSAACAMVGTGKVTKIRGYLFHTVLGSFKAVPTLHPAATLRGQFIQRHHIVNDLRKVAAESTFPELVLPDDPIWVPKSYTEAVSALEYLRQYDPSSIYASIDIETNNHEVSCIGFAAIEEGKAEMAVTVPMYAVGGPPWTLEEEIHLWTIIAEILAEPEVNKLFQNGIFDQFFLIQRMGIYTAGRFDDTMIGHHILYPDFPKGLEFLGSIYTRRPHWKSMVSFKAKDKMKADD